MEEENENKTQPAAEEPQAAAESVATVETPDTDAPKDGAGCEAVTVVIIARDEKRGELAAMSVRKNLIGVDAEVHVVSGADVCDTDVETLLKYLPLVKTERIILMLEGMLILNPVTIYDIGVQKVPADCVPSLMHKSALEQLLSWMHENAPHADIAYENQSRVLHDVAPITLGDWKTDPWLLPIVSENPPRKALEKYAPEKKFAYVSPQSWTDEVVQFFEERFAE